MHPFPITLISVGVAFTVRVLAVRDHWPQIIPKDVSSTVPLVMPPAGRRRGV